MSYQTGGSQYDVYSWNFRGFLRKYSAVETKKCFITTLNTDVSQGIFENLGNKYDAEKLWKTSLTCFIYHVTQLLFIYSKSTIKILEKGVKYF